MARSYSQIDFLNQKSIVPKRQVIPVSFFLEKRMLKTDSYQLIPKPETIFDYIPDFPTEHLFTQVFFSSFSCWEDAGWLFIFKDEKDIYYLISHDYSYGSPRISWKHHEIIDEETVLNIMLENEKNENEEIVPLTAS